MIIKREIIIFILILINNIERILLACLRIILGKPEYVKDMLP